MRDVSQPAAEAAYRDDPARIVNLRDALVEENASANQKPGQHADNSFAVSCAMGSVYRFLEGAGPFGCVEAVWSLAAARRWWKARTTACRFTKSLGRTYDFLIMPGIAWGVATDRRT